MTQRMVRVLREEHGQDLIEYALLASLISVIAMEAILSVGGAVRNLWDLVIARMPDAS